MPKRQQNSRPAQFCDNTSRYNQVVYPGAVKKIISKQQTIAPTTHHLSSNIPIDSNKDKTNIGETSSKINKLNCIETTTPSISERENNRTELDTKPDTDDNNYINSVVDNQPNLDNINNRPKANNQSADIENPNIRIDTNNNYSNNYNNNRSFDLDWVDSRKVQCDLIYGPKRNSLASNNITKIQHKRYQYQTDNSARSNHNLPFPLYLRRSDQNILDNYNKLSTTSSSNNTLSKSNKTSQYRFNHMASNNNDTDILFDISNDEATGFYDDGQNLEGQLADGQLNDDRNKKGQVPYDLNQLDEPIMSTLLRDLGGIYEKMKIIALPNRSNDIYKIILRGWDLWGPLLLCTFLAFSLHNDTTNSTRSSIGPHFADVFVLIWFGSGLLSLNYRLLCLSSINDQSIRIMPGFTNSSTTDTSGDKTTINGGSNLRINNNNNKINDDIITSPNRSIPIGPSVDLGMITNPDDNLASTSMHEPMQLSITPPSILQLMCVFGYCLVAPSFGLFILKFIPISSLMIWRVIVGLTFGFIWPTWSSIKILKQYQHPDKRALAIYPIGLFYFILSCMIILNQ